MKDSKEYSKKVHKLYRSLKRKYPKSKKVLYDEPLEAIVYAIVSENTTKRATQSAMKRLDEHFVDLNDLRVSRMEEITEVLGDATAVAGNMASALTAVLRAAFEQYNVVSLEALKKLGKRPARQLLEKMEGTDLFVIDYCMLTSLQGHAIPLTKQMIEYLRCNELVHPNADEQQIEGFLARQISAENAYEFYALLRRESESGKAGRKKRPASKAKAKVKRKKKG